MALRVTRAPGRLDLRVVCDECGTEIREADDGALCWRADRADTELCVTHGACRSRFERLRGGRWSSDSARHLPIRLAAALALPIEAVERGAALDYVLRGRLESSG
jgi:hypothetical protein